jgi:uncharacterized protein (DUF58 family)
MSALFDAEYLGRVEYLALLSRRAFDGALLARKRTKKLGSGVEFADHRAYTATDDYRYLDWQVFARHGTLLVKRFQEEEDLHVYIFLDCSRSMGAGGPPKFDYARRVAGALAHIALDDLDRVAVTTFAGRLLADFPPARGKGRLLTLLRFLEEQRVADGPTDLTAACRAFVHRSPRRGLVVLVSDLYDPAGVAPALDVLRHHRHDVRVVQLHAPEEAQPALRGDVELVDMETSAARRVTVNEAALRDYRRRFTAFQSELSGYCRRHSFASTSASTAEPFDDLVVRMMREAAAGP